MFNHDSRQFTAPQFGVPQFGTPQFTQTPGYTHNPYTPSFAPSYTSTTQDMTYLAHCLEAVRAQVAALTEIVRFETLRKTTGHLHDYQHEFNPIRLRESDSHIFLDICLPQLTMGDVELEVSGNRIICRTRVPVSPMSRTWVNQQIPRGFEIFELADGRVEFSWIAPVLFQAKEIEATWREGFLAICIPKAEVAQRHTVKIVKETAGTRKAAGDMNS